MTHMNHDLSIVINFNHQQHAWTNVYVNTRVFFEHQQNVL